MTLVSQLPNPFISLISTSSLGLLFAWCQTCPSLFDPNTRVCTHTHVHTCVHTHTSAPPGFPAFCHSISLLVTANLLKEWPSLNVSHISHLPYFCPHPMKLFLPGPSLTPGCLTQWPVSRSYSSWPLVVLKSMGCSLLLETFPGH